MLEQPGKTSLLVGGGFGCFEADALGSYKTHCPAQPKPLGGRGKPLGGQPLLKAGQQGGGIGSRRCRLHSPPLIGDGGVARLDSQAVCIFPRPTVKAKWPKGQAVISDHHLVLALGHCQGCQKSLGGFCPGGGTYQQGKHRHGLVHFLNHRVKEQVANLANVLASGLVHTAQLGVAPQNGFVPASEVGTGATPIGIEPRQVNQVVFTWLG